MKPVRYFLRKEELIGENNPQALFKIENNMLYRCDIHNIDRREVGFYTSLYPIKEVFKDGYREISLAEVALLI